MNKYFQYVRFNTFMKYLWNSLSLVQDSFHLWAVPLGRWSGTKRSNVSTSDGPYEMFAVCCTSLRTFSLTANRGEKYKLLFSNTAFSHLLQSNLHITVLENVLSLLSLWLFLFQLNMNITRIHQPYIFLTYLILDLIFPKARTSCKFTCFENIFTVNFQ